MFCTERASIVSTVLVIIILHGISHFSHIAEWGFVFIRLINLHGIFVCRLYIYTFGTTFNDGFAISILQTDPDEVIRMFRMYVVYVIAFIILFLLFFCSAGSDSNLLIVFYVQIMPDDFVMQLHRF